MELLRGEFVDVLPVSRSFEFRLANAQEIIRSRMSSHLHDVDELNKHLNQAVQIQVTLATGGRATC